jgi:hypothetical protein
MNGGTNGPMLKTAGLWAKTSVKGGQYLGSSFFCVHPLGLSDWG